MRDPKEFTDTDGTILYEFNAQVGNGTVLEGQGSTLAQKYSVTVAKVVDGSSLEYRVVRFLSNDNRSMTPVSFRDKADFTGTVYYYDLKGRTERVEGYKDGILKAVSGDIGKGGTSLASRVPKDCLPDDPYCDGGFFIYEPVSHYTDWYNVRGNRLDYSHSTYEYTSYIKVWVPSNGGGAPARNYHERLDAPAPHGPGGTWHASNHPKEIIKDPSIIGTKAECVYEKLASTNEDIFKETIGKFVKDPKYDLILKVGKCNNSDIACTDGSKVDINGDITMIIEDVTQPPLELAATILHEGIHAEIYRYVNLHENGLDSNDRARIFQLYQYYKGLSVEKTYTGNPVTNAQHVYMAENYVKPIASAIRQLDNNRYPLEYYMWYGWEGLEGEDFQNKLTSELISKYNNFQETVNGTTKFKCN